jgi:hypothetical protein
MSNLPVTPVDEATFDESAIQKVFPFAPSATSYGKGWKELQALRYCNSHISELSVAVTPKMHLLILHVRPPKKMDLRYEGVKRDMPPPAGSIAVVPAGSSVLVRWQGSIDVLHVLLEPSASQPSHSNSIQPGRWCHRSIA